jgi:hypothetical protein
MTTKSEPKKIATIVTSGAITTNQKKHLCLVHIYIYIYILYPKCVRKKKVLLHD